MTEQQLNELAVEWMDHLRLRDWRIKVVVKRHADMADKAGTVRWCRGNKEAFISILHPDHQPEEMDFPRPVETTLVHELLHIHLATFFHEEGTPENLDLEQAICAISECLVALKREAQVCGRSYDGKCPMPQPKPMEEKRGSGDHCPYCGYEPRMGERLFSHPEHRLETCCRSCGVWSLWADWHGEGETPSQPEPTENDDALAAWQARQQKTGCICELADTQECYDFQGCGHEGPCWCRCHAEPSKHEQPQGGQVGSGDHHRCVSCNDLFPLSELFPCDDGADRCANCHSEWMEHGGPQTNWKAAKHEQPQEEKPGMTFQKGFHLHGSARNRWAEATGAKVEVTDSGPRVMYPNCAVCGEAITKPYDRHGVTEKDGGYHFEHLGCFLKRHEFVAGIPRMVAKAPLLEETDGEGDR